MSIGFLYFNVLLKEYIVKNEENKCIDQRNEKKKQ